MEKENKEKEKSSAQKEKASRGRVASDNLFLAKKCLYGERVAPDNFFIPKRKNRPYGSYWLHTRTGNYSYNLLKKMPVRLRTPW